MKKLLIVIVIIISGIKSTAQVSNRNLFIDSVFNYICESKILHAEIVIKQACPVRTSGDGERADPRDGAGWFFAGNEPFPGLATVQSTGL